MPCSCDSKKWGFYWVVKCSDPCGETNLTQERLERILLEANNIAVLCGLIAWLKTCDSNASRAPTLRRNLERRHEQFRELYREEVAVHVTRLFSMCGLKGR
jgi:hypothetical protein